MSQPTLLFCAECRTPIAELQGDNLVIRSRHHGHTHITVLPVAKLAEMVEDAKAVKNVGVTKGE